LDVKLLPSPKATQKQQGIEVIKVSMVRNEFWIGERVGIPLLRLSSTTWSDFVSLREVKGDAVWTTRFSRRATLIEAFPPMRCHTVFILRNAAFTCLIVPWMAISCGEGAATPAEISFRVNPTYRSNSPEFLPDMACEDGSLCRLHIAQKRSAVDMKLD